MKIAADRSVCAVPSQQQCLDLARRISTSAEFRRAKRLQEFLGYIVDRTLAGAPEEVTEVLIGERVFGRPVAYNPAEDSIVRTEARNLRLRLERYFGAEGAAEPLILEIPKGAYLPVFRWKDPISLEPASPGVLQPTLAPPNRRGWLAACAAVPLAAIAGWRFGVAEATTGGNSPRGSGALPTLNPGRVRLESSDARLVSEFLAAKTRALTMVYSGDKIGNWYDASMGEHYSFCARDVAHQAAGAAVLGLAPDTQNMLRRFAGSVTRERNWRAYWEINKDGFPITLHGDAGDHYCLPASFDLLQACYREFLWRGDETYFDSVFSYFYDRTMTSFLQAWDPKNSGLLESAPETGMAAVPSYWEHDPRMLTGGDLFAAQYAAHLAYASIQRRKGTPGSLSLKVAADHTGRALALRMRYNSDWWSAERNRHYSGLLPDRTYYPGYLDDANAQALRFHLPQEGAKTQAALDALEAHRPAYDQTYSYFPDILFEYGRHDSAYRVWRELAERDPKLPMIPEMSFVAVGAIAAGMMGLAPNAPDSTLETLPRLPSSIEWVKLGSVPILRNEITVLHHGLTETTVTNESGPVFQWKPAFLVDSAGRMPKIMIDGAPVEVVLEHRLNGQTVMVASAPVKPATSRTARLWRS